eukprot:scaffold26146_cov36-Phaeocystis_antarctica.AAC.1
MGTRSVLSSDGRHRETLGQYGRHSTIWDLPLRSTGSAMQVRAGRLELGAIRTAHANRQSVCSAHPAPYIRTGGACDLPRSAENRARQTVM